MKVLFAPAHKGLDLVQPYQPGKPIEELEREFGIRHALKLASNENPYGPSPKALVAARASLRKIHRYPDASSFYLKKAIAAKFRVSEDRIAIGNGSDELIVMAIRAFVSAGDEVMTATPTFLIYKIATQVHGAQIVQVPQKDFRYDLKAMLRAITPKTKMIFIANPDNPTGSYVTDTELKDFLKKVPSRCLVFMDEAYYEYASHEKNYPQTLGLLSQPNLIISRTFSKAYGLCGLRVGYSFAHPQVTAGMNKVREPFNINGPAQAAALAALTDNAFLKKVVSQTCAERARVDEGLCKRGFKTVPSASNFILFHAGAKAHAIYEGLLRRGVIVRHMKSWGLEEYIRVTIGRPQDNRVFLKAIDAII
jgi:histidinol-phosphate aminotransferase